MSDRFILAQISDTHVRTDDGGAAAAQLRKALEQAREYRADAIVLTGDLANDERADEYAVFADALTHAHAPAFVLPGNHDDRNQLRAALPGHDYLPRQGALSFVIDAFPVRLLALDQIAPGETHGLFTLEMARWLDHSLSQAPEKPTIVALHHPPFRSHDELFDSIGLRGEDLFAQVIARHRQVMRILCGHHHRLVVGQVAHAPVVAAPSTSWTYGLALHTHQPVAPITREPTGFMLHVWSLHSGCASHCIAL